MSALYAREANLPAGFKDSVLTTTICKLGKEVFATDPGGGAAGAAGGGGGPSDPRTAELLRWRANAAYACVSAVVRRTQTQEKFFFALLFQVTPRWAAAPNTQTPPPSAASAATGRTLAYAAA